jgi:hypothetical protein
MGQDVLLHNVTPAEAVFLVAEHNARAGGIPLVVVGEPTEVERTSAHEIGRLYAKYQLKKIKSVFPNAMGQVPATFDEAIQIGMGTSIPSGKLMEFQV